MSDLETSRPHYISFYVRFGLILVLLNVLVGAVRVLWDVDGMVGFALVLPVLAALGVVDTFIKKKRRVPSDREIKLLSGWCLKVTMFVGVVFTGFDRIAVNPDQGLRATDLVIIGGLLLATLMFNYLSMRWAFGSAAKKHADKLGIGRPDDNL